MPRKAGTGKGESDRFNIRVDWDTGAFYRRKANEHGISPSEYLRQLLVQGVITETVQEIETRLMGVLSRMSAGSGGGGGVEIPDEVVLSILTSEEMLAAIVEARDPQELYRAQDRAREKMKRMKGAKNG
ncbi:hypothetical protein WS86_00040 (plasmid) [Burkholderia savannae]|uniref:Uncharacterized protein n=1 Tax=Burkholderia savannae TaxID=1637837 RepID=A0ABR5T8G1_9BURK|nr:hypothetical protein [Burkholderia savannae]AOJ79174.1 hypothetical protein WS86_00040 [Burkholderia savannae]KWZ39567.1 hypothetical protein WS72_19365 [Burkholderia savannae]